MGAGMVLDRLRRFLTGSGEVSAGIRPTPGGKLERLLQAIEQDPDWKDSQGLVMVAPLEPDTNPLCLAGDGDRHPPGTTKESLKLNHHRYGNCDCYLLPVKWTKELICDPQGQLHPTTQLATGDNGEESVPGSLTAEQWLRANPRTAEAVLSARIASALLGRLPNGIPLPPIPLKEAVRRWMETLEPMNTYEQHFAEAKEFYKQRQDPEMLRCATELLESCLPIMHSSLEAFKRLDRAQGNSDVCRYGEAFIQLAIIYEKQGRFQEAIDVCQSARDAGWAGDWEQRIFRLHKRQSINVPS